MHENHKVREASYKVNSGDRDTHANVSGLGPTNVSEVLANN